MDELINKEWKTTLSTKADKEGIVSFRGFRGNYLLSWESNGKKHSQAVVLE